MIKELWILIKMFFASNPSATRDVKVVDMRHFPFKGYKAMSWCGYIIHRVGTSDIDNRTRVHETIHLNQAKAVGSWWKYYSVYLLEWIKGNPVIAPASSAYYTNPFEMEAYANEDNPNYLVTDKSLKRYDIKNRKKTYRKYRVEWKEYIRSL